MREHRTGPEKIDIGTGSGTLISGGASNGLAADFDNPIGYGNAGVGGGIDLINISTSESSSITSLTAESLAFAPVPIPAAAWLFGSALGLLRRMRKHNWRNHYFVSAKSCLRSGNGGSRRWVSPKKSDPIT